MKTCYLTLGLALAALSPRAHAQDSFINVPGDLLATIGDILPESSNAGAAYVSEVYSPNLVISEPASVEVTFLHEGAGYRNSLGYFTYRNEADGSVTILSSELLIADASTPWPVVPGDTYSLKDASGQVRVFEAGEQVGFFIVADGWNRVPELRDGTLDGMEIPTSTPSGNSTIGRGCYTSLNRINPEFDSPNPERGRHLAMIWMPSYGPGFMGGDPFLVCGFEDLNRNGPSDEDFNDLVFIVSSNPIEAIEDTEAFSYVEGDPDGDTVSGALDQFPLNPDRSRVVRYPSYGYQIIAFEDQYPGVGDADYNDIVLAYATETVYGAQGHVTELLLTYHLIARGAGYEHSVWLDLPGLVSAKNPIKSVEGYQSDGEQWTTSFAADHTGPVEVFWSTYTVLPPIGGASFTNTQSGTVERSAASARVLYEFALDGSPGATEIGSAPFDLFVKVHHGEERWDVHFPGLDALPDRPAHLPAEGVEGTSFIDSEGRPWLIEVPGDWRFPLERERIWNTHPSYTSWVASLGTQSQDWYDHPAPQAPIGPDVGQFLPTRTWSLGLPPSTIE